MSTVKILGTISCDRHGTTIMHKSLCKTWNMENVKAYNIDIM